MKRSESNEHGVSQVELVVKNLPANAGDLRDTGGHRWIEPVSSWIGKNPWRMA